MSAAPLGAAGDVAAAAAAPSAAPAVAAPVAQLRLTDDWRAYRNLDDGSWYFMQRSTRATTWSLPASVPLPSLRAALAAAAAAESAGARAAADALGALPACEPTDEELDRA